MSDFFDEKLMFEKLNQYLPEGESFLAAVKAIGNEMVCRQSFIKFKTLGNDMIGPSDEDPNLVLDVQRAKYAAHDIYVGITENCIVFNECEAYKHAYFYNQAKPGEFEPMEVTAEINLREFGHAQAITDIREVKVKKGLFGQLKVEITFKNGSVFRFSVPKRAGVGNGMPHHAENLEKLAERLKAMQKDA